MSLHVQLSCTISHVCNLEVDIFQPTLTVYSLQLYTYKKLLSVAMEDIILIKVPYHLNLPHSMTLYMAVHVHVHMHVI